MSIERIAPQPAAMNFPGTSWSGQQTGGIATPFDSSDIMGGATMAARRSQTDDFQVPFDSGDIMDGGAMAALESPSGIGLSEPGMKQQLFELLKTIMDLLSNLLKRDEPQSESSDTADMGYESGGGAGWPSATPGGDDSRQMAGPAQAGSMPVSANAGAGLSETTAKSNSGLAQWNNDIAIASSISGLDPNKIGAHVWAESRGRADTTTTNIDGTKDRGLIQIGQERWNRDVVPKLTAQEKADIKKATGKDAADLDVSKPLDNLIAGSLHIKQSIEFKGGNKDAGTKYYNDGDVTGTGDIYLKRVNYYEDLLKNGKALSMEDPF